MHNAYLQCKDGEKDKEQKWLHFTTRIPEMLGRF